ncbi:MAG: biotin-dependent carboxyltransferase family protein [Acutalibacteraceae bacterium]
MNIISPGLLTTVQDLGRFGYMESGFSPCGAMDSFSARLANILVDNSERDGVLEMTMIGVTAVFDEDNIIAITGAEFAPKINGVEVPMNSAVRINSGDVLECGSAIAGCRGYLAVAGGFDIAPVMGSMSTNLKCGIGGFHGRKLVAGDIIPLRHSQDRLYGMSSRSLELKSDSRQVKTIHVIFGPQDDYFSQSSKDTFCSEIYKVTAQSDRMGIKLDGASVEAIDGVDIISDGIALGSVQIPSSGKPIIMMADRQTTGGYAKVATVITADIPVLAQMRPGDSLKFQKVDLNYARNRIKENERILKKLKDDIIRADTILRYV